MESVGAAVWAGALEAGHEAEVAGGHLGHDVGEDHGVIPAVAPGHEADPVAAHILKRIKKYFSKKTLQFNSKKI